MIGNLITVGKSVQIRLSLCPGQPKRRSIFFGNVSVSPVTETEAIATISLLDKAMNKYGNAAVRAVKTYGPLAVSPREAWDKATTDIFGAGSSNQDKGCPRCAFLGLCEEGLLSRFPKGRYTQSIKNKEYALHALRLLRHRQDLTNDPDGLWRAVMNGKEKKHNSQMDVVVALWTSGLLK